MRGVLAVILTIFVVLLGIFMGGASLEPMGELVKDNDADDAIGKKGIVSDYYTAFFVGMPLVLITGMIGWAVAWYLRDERFVGRRGR